MEAPQKGWQPAGTSVAIKVHVGRLVAGLRAAEIKGRFSSSPPLLRIHLGKQLLAPGVCVLGADFFSPLLFCPAGQGVPALETEGLRQKAVLAGSSFPWLGWPQPCCKPILAKSACLAASKRGYTERPTEKAPA